MIRVVYTDGGCSGDDKHGAACFLVTNDDHIETLKCEYINCPITNNIAEYTAIINALLWCRYKGYKGIRVCSDSQLVIRQLVGLYVVKSELLLPYHTLANILSRGMDISFVWVPRTNKFVSEADRTCDKAIRGRCNVYT